LVGVKYPEEATLYSLDAVGNRKGEKRALPALVSALTVAAYAALAPGNALGVTERDYNAVDWMVAKHQVMPVGPTTAVVYDVTDQRRRDDDRAAT